jgi:hypothetical protein
METVNKLIDLNELCVNDVILAELIPSINQRREFELKELLLSIPKLQLRIDWNDLVSMQTENLRNGINKVGMADLMIAQNAMQNGIPLFSCDRHFQLMTVIMPLPLFQGTV